MQPLIVTIKTVLGHFTGGKYETQVINNLLVQPLNVMTKTYTVVRPYPQELYFKSPSGCLKP